MPAEPAGGGAACARDRRNSATAEAAARRVGRGYHIMQGFAFASGSELLEIADRELIVGDVRRGFNLVEYKNRLVRVLAVDHR